MESVPQEDEEELCKQLAAAQARERTPEDDRISALCELFGISWEEVTGKVHEEWPDFIEGVDPEDRCP